MTGLPLPAFRPSWPTASRVRVGEFDGRRPVRRFHFDVAYEVDQEGQKRFVTSEKLMVDLGNEQGLQVTKLRSGKLVYDDGGQPRDYEPRSIPIELHSDDLNEMLLIRLSRWRRSGPDCTAKDFRHKTPEELQTSEQQEALRMQNLLRDADGDYREPTPDDFADMPELWVGRCLRYEYAQRGAGEKTAMAQVGKTPGTCDPLVCPHFRPADRDAPKCKPEVRFHFRLPWAGHRSWAHFVSTSWATASKLATTLADLKDNLGGRLRGVECLLVTQPEKRRTPDGTRQTQPVVYIATAQPIRELRAGMQELLALEQSVVHLPLPEHYAEDAARAKALAEEFHPEVFSAEREWQKRAAKAGMSSDWIEATLAATDGDADALDAALEAAVRNGDTPTTLFEEGEE